jgi:hypothetical protein
MGGFPSLIFIYKFPAPPNQYQEHNKRPHDLENLNMTDKTKHWTIFFHKWLFQIELLDMYMSIERRVKHFLFNNKLKLLESELRF